MAEQAHALRVVGRSGVLAWRRLPASQLPERISRKAKRQVASGRDLLIHSVVAPLSSSNAAVVRYAMVLGGHSLNVHATLPPGSVANATAELVLSHAGRELTVPARVARAKGDRPGVTATATALLGEQVRGLAITPGRWTMALRVTAPGGVPEEFRLIGTGDTPILSGPSSAFTACPVSGLRMRTGLNPAGRLKLIVLEPAQRAEIVRVARKFSGLTMEFRAPAGGGRLRAQDGHRTVALKTEPIPGTPGGYRCELPLTALQSADSGRNWTFRWVSSNGHKHLLRRQPDDVRGLRSMQNAALKLAIADPRGRLHFVTQKTTLRGTYQLAFEPAPGPAAPVKQSISTATTGSLK